MRNKDLADQQEFLGWQILWFNLRQVIDRAISNTYQQDNNSRNYRQNPSSSSLHEEKVLW